MAAEKITGTLIEYQGYRCGPYFKMDRPVGLETGRGFVHIAVSEFKEFKIVDNFEASDDVHTTSKGSQTGFTTAGTLRITEMDPRNVQWDCVLGNILISEEGIQCPIATDDVAGGVVRVSLMDIRGLWGRRGYVTRWLNVLKQGAGQDVGNQQAAAEAAAKNAETTVRGFQNLLEYVQSGGGADIIKGTGGVNAANQAAGGGALIDAIKVGFNSGTFGNSQGIFDQITKILNTGTIQQLIDFLAQQLASAQQDADKTKASASNNIFLPGSVGNDGIPFNLREALVVFVLPYLPGKPILRRLPGDLEQAIPMNHIWETILAKQALDELLNEFRLICVLNNDGASVSLYHEGEGGLEKDAGQNDGIPYPTDDNSVFLTPELATAKKIVANHWVPPLVVVRGPHTYLSALSSLEPCGELFGRVVDLQTFLAGIGLSDSAGRRFIFLKAEQKAALGVTQDGIEQFTRCAWKWWRLPGDTGEDVVSGNGETKKLGDRFLPVGDRAIIDIAGQVLPPRVFAERCVSASLALLKRLDGKENLARKLKDMVDEKTADLILKDQQNSAETAKRAELLVFGKKGATGKKKKKVVTGEDAEEADQVEVQLKTDEILKARDAAVEKFKKKMAGVNNMSMLINLPFAEHPSTGYRIDRNRGIVMFEAPIGLVDDEGVAPEVAQFARDDARVALEFGYTKKASVETQLSLDDRYWSAWQRKTDGSIVQVTALPSGIPYSVIDRPDFLMVVGLHGETNKPILDGLSLKAATDRLKRPSIAVGGEYAFSRPVPLQGNGRCLSITYETTARGEPAFKARLEAEAPLPTRPEFSTFALPRQGDSKHHLNVHAPKSTRKDH